MRNSTGYLKIMISSSIRTFFVAIFCLILLANSPVQAQEKEIDIVTSSGSVGYTIEDNGSLKGRVLITLTNNSNESTAVRFFKTSIPFSRTNSMTVSYGGVFLESAPEETDGRTKLNIDLQNRVIRPGQSIDIIIDFSKNAFIKTESALLSIPTRYDIDKTKKITLILPDTLGQELDIQPSDFTEKKLSRGNMYEFEELNGQDISIILKDELTYSFKQINKLENNDSISKKFDVLIPPSNEMQSLIINQISPKPDSVQIDSEDNILLKYELQPNQSFEVTLIGFLKRKLINIPERSLASNPLLVEMSDYWKLEEKDINIATRVIGDREKNNWQEIDTSRRKSLVKGISSFVVQRLETPTTEEKQIVNARIGASGLINGYDEADSRDYVDLTIALLRIYSIPSRQVVGYSTNIHNVFNEATTHTWVEYWEPEAGWVSLDTYQDEIFNTNRSSTPNADTIALMYRGFSSSYPVYTSYSLKELEVSLSDHTVQPISQFETIPAKTTWSLQDRLLKIPVVIRNSGSTIINSYEILSNSNKVLTSEEVAILPGEQYESFIYMSSDEIETENLEGELVLGVSASTLADEKMRSDLKVSIEFQEAWWWKPLITTVSVVIFFGIMLIVFELLNIQGKKSRNKNEVKIKKKDKKKQTTSNKLS